MNTRHQAVRCALLFSSLLAISFSTRAADPGSVRGHVRDPLGGAVPNAEVRLLSKNAAVSSSRTDAQGNFAFTSVSSRQYSVQVDAPGFSRAETREFFLLGGQTTNIEVVLQIGPLKQEVVVSDTGMEIPESQVGASVNVIDSMKLQAEGKPDVLEALRLVPGLQVVQTGQRGGTTSLFARGGNANFNKVLLDGIAVNDIGGDFEFANLSANGVDRIEILQGPNSVLYGTDALGSVLNITTRRGRTTIPELAYSFDGGNFGTLRHEGSLGGAYKRFDYFSDFTRFDTQNSLPNSTFHNGTYAGNFGLALNQTTDVRLTVRRTVVALGDPNALDFYGIADDSSQREQDFYHGLTLNNQTTGHWHNLVRYAFARSRFHFVNPSPTGTPFDPFGFGPNYLGNTVTIRGANGFSATGQAILDFGGQYPQTFDARTTRRSVYAQSDYSLRPNLTGSLGFRFENEHGLANSQASLSSTSRKNYSSFLELHGSLFGRLYGTAGVGLEHNATFGFAATPRVSLAYYLRRPTSAALLGGIKLRFNYGKGIKEPSLFDESSSLFTLLSGLPQGSSLISQFHISPVMPERSRSFDFGIEQGFWNERARLSLTFFHSRFFDLFEFVDKSALPLLGVPSNVVDAIPFGATVNSLSYRALGSEAEFKADLGHGFNFDSWYTYLDPVVTRSFSSSALQPAFNPAFPNIPIGAFSPLVGGRPFRRAPHSGGLFVGYARRKFAATLSGYFVSRQDDSTFLTDGFFGNSMLLPNRNLNASYQKVDLNGRYALHRGVALYTSIENLLSQKYDPAFGFPALPLTFRTGIKFTIGGEGWRPK